MAEIKIKSKYAIIDVSAGRKALEKHFGGRNGWRENDDRCIPITITGFIDGCYGEDDGISQEFTVTPTKIVIKQPKARK